MMLQAQNLHLTVPGKVLCQDLTLTLDAGQCWAILGKNGSGKTTMIQVLCGLAKPAAGQILLDGKVLAGIPRRPLAQRIGVLLQEESTAFSGPVLDYVLLGRFPHAGSWRPDDSDLEAALQALKQTGMVQAQAQSFATLSGGERQRVRIAQLLAQEPGILFLDEPLQHLDLPHQLAMMKLLREIAIGQRKTVIMVLHDIFWASHFCSHTLLIHDDGKILSGESTRMFSVDNMETLYQCDFQEIKTSDGNYFLPTLE
ncbi:MAG: ABC transporter ATP-binding protein [Sulfurimicrobium sp.]|jgi:iron complex transport system ATP-binding protein|nr:ABC transporter ATP-binding protein [Sulfurimicrobium sp.]MDZ7654786.1 ABC transporter ATP-binding protein [Sulfurimicrobium sp.]